MLRVPPDQGNDPDPVAICCSRTDADAPKRVSPARRTQLQILTGTGSPEGVIEAKAATLYMNTAGTAGSILYIKRDDDISGDRSQGWILV